MAEDVVDTAIEKAALSQRLCITREMKIYGADQAPMPADISSFRPEAVYQLVKASVEKEMCMTVEDFLSRRTRTLLLDAKRAIDAAPSVAGAMAKALNKDSRWTEEQISSFKSMATHYLPIVN